MCELVSPKQGTYFGLIQIIVLVLVSDVISRSKKYRIFFLSRQVFDIALYQVRKWWKHMLKVSSILRLYIVNGAIGGLWSWGLFIRIVITQSE